MNEEAQHNELLPKHIAVIMDGNGRWARSHGLQRMEGHRRGVNIARDMVKLAHKKAVRYMTFFVFSSENWSRPEQEVTGLMSILRLYMNNEVKELEKYNARLRVIGDRTRLPKDIVESIEKWEEKTKNNDEIYVTMAINYGGRDDIVSAVKKIVSDKTPIGKINESLFADNLMTHGLPDPDLLIRTSGELRVSNFLLWQLAYTEMYFTKTAWPDFDEKEFDKALDFYTARDRRYGSLTKKSAEGLQL